MEDDEIIISVDLNGKSNKEKKKIKQIGKKNKKKEKDIRTSKTIRERKKMSLKKKVIIVILVLIAIVLLLHSSLFSVKEIKVEGNDYLSQDRVIEFSGITYGENLFSHSKRDISKSLLENSYIESAQVHKKLPNTIEISIVERKINYMIQFSDTYVYINNQGYILEQTTEMADVPLVIGLITDQNMVEVGKRLCDDDLINMNKVIKIYELAKVNDISEYISKIDISNEKNYIIELESRGKVVDLGDCSNYSDINTKMLYLASILAVTDDSREEIFLNVDLNNNKAYSRPISE